MGFWGALAGVTVGVGAVALAPFTGGGSLVGVGLAASLAGAGAVAAGAGVVGACVGAAAGEIIDDEKAKKNYDQGKREGARETEAKYRADIDKLNIKLARTIAMLCEHGNHFNAIIAMAAVGFACANCDGEISVEESEEINIFVTGVSHSTLPEKVKTDIQSFNSHPPSLVDAFAMAMKSGVEDMSIFEDIIEVVMTADGVVKQQEETFLLSWRTMSAA